MFKTSVGNEMRIIKMLSCTSLFSKKLPILDNKIPHQPRKTLFSKTSLIHDVSMIQFYLCEVKKKKKKKKREQLDNSKHMDDTFVGILIQIRVE